MSAQDFHCRSHCIRKKIKPLVQKIYRTNGYSDECKRNRSKAVTGLQRFHQYIK